MQDHPLLLHCTNLIFMLNKAYHRWNWNVKDTVRFYANQVSGIGKWWIMINVGTWETASIFAACYNTKFAMQMMSFPSTTNAYLDSYTIHCIMNLNYWIISANMRWTKFSAGKEACLFAYSNHRIQAHVLEYWGWAQAFAVDQTERALLKQMRKYPRCYHSYPIEVHIEFPLVRWKAVYS